ncbi:UV radiation resistance protein [Histoplasma capsulatum]|uniref:Autophagy-related protein 14 n=1 Tax=Ajellomyces capsulatus TaxID=5037 RepID=A0A8A1MLE9_AJECA|nr:conserved hypothetical protein [Histoplasma mississippiense (nom. inval.)]EDN05878.1 conserved hypothetical protein [Histoplasma mississippiense (nom. inval.)]QSS65412.1 UV radiation resistance protein [Histoplasma capsulatum]
MALSRSADDLVPRLEQLSASDSRRQKPWFSNRKLRHLQGISLRNLTVNPNTPSSRKTIDDDSVPNALQSPTKLLAMRELPSPIPQSRSFTDLKRRDQFSSADATAAAAAASPLGTSGSENQKEQKNKAQILRRRSTLRWAGASPFIRQHRLEDIAGNRMANSWFSLHCAGMDQPVYVSEVVGRAMNPDFKHFDLNVCGPLVSRLDQVTCNVWARTEDMTEYILLLRLEVNLRSLQYVGKTLESFYHPLPTNCVVFHFQDGVYTSLMDMPPVQQLPAPVTTASAADARAHDDSRLQSTSTYDALMRLANLDDCIQDALATREKLETQINAILERNHRALDTVCSRSQAVDKLSSVKRTITSVKKQLRQSKQRKEEIQRSLEARRTAMARGRSSQEKTKSFLSEAQSSMSSSENLLRKTAEDSMGQIRRICEELQAIYPIEPIPEKPLAFTICSRALPNSTFEDMDKECIAAALGYTAHLVYLLSFYLSVPLPYPVRPYLSHSLIDDPISAGLPQRTFPLYPVNGHYRFEYGVFLLNKNIEYMMNRMGLRVIDVRHTLPNLKYLLYVLTAGTGELPARQAGGVVRGLLLGVRGRAGSHIIRSGLTSPSVSRRGSEDSVVSGAGPGAGGAGSIMGDGGPGSGARKLLQENILAKANGQLAVDRRLAGGGKA